LGAPVPGKASGASQPRQRAEAKPTVCTQS
jgi:hypothetical protein